MRARNKNCWRHSHGVSGQLIYSGQFSEHLMPFRDKGRGQIDVKFYNRYDLGDIPELEPEQLYSSNPENSGCEFYEASCPVWIWNILTENRKYKKIKEN